jgi:CRP/FNR family transcriptional regulator, cyclic AMP receptor protein
MISPELLRRFPFFGNLENSQLVAISIIAEEETFNSGEEIFQERNPAESLYLLEEGSIDLYFTVVDNFHPELRKEFSVGEINPGEPFGISALIEPYILTAAARVSSPSKVIKINASSLRSTMDTDPSLSCALMRKMAKAAIDRLNDTRIQLAAARA